MSEPLLEVENVSIRYRTNAGDIRAVNDVSLTVDEGEYFGLVGESGSGKSTIAKAIVGGLDDNGEITSGRIKFKGEEIQDYSDERLSKEIRWNEVAMIPQGSMNNLDPIMRLSEQAIEVAKTHTDWTKARTVERFEELFEVVGLPTDRIHDYPHQFSGGMQQRAVIALALLLEPSLVIADEPTTARDVIMQDQILKHLVEIKDTHDASLVMITHDISVVFETCDSMAILHGGQLAERGPIIDLFDDPRHPYSILLQQAFPDIRHLDRKLATIDGQPPELKDEVDYCSFAGRCPWATNECLEGAPPIEPVEGEEEHVVGCIRSHEMDTLVAEYREQNEEPSRLH